MVLPSIIFDDSLAVSRDTSPASTKVVSSAKSHMTSDQGNFPYGKIL
ncbi:MAG: hypothetical protein N4A76_01340 [Firmicutes bacterium]|jgi:hypothetical protein|nr:hypothetical protein [Bacillota bacterium]